MDFYDINTNIKNANCEYILRIELSGQFKNNLVKYVLYITCLQKDSITYFYFSGIDSLLVGRELDNKKQINITLVIKYCHKNIGLMAVSISWFQTPALLAS